MTTPVRSSPTFDLSSLRKIPLLSELPDEQLLRVAADLRLRQYAKRDIVINKGSAGDALLFLLAGQVQVVDVTEDGRAIGLNLLRPGDFFGEIAVIDGGTRSASVTALTEATVAFLPRNTALWLFSHCASVAERILQHMAKKIRRESEFRALLSIHNAFRRVYALLDLLKQTQPGGIVVVESLPTQQDIAIMVNTSRETVSRAMAHVLEQGIVEKDMRRLIIRKPEVLSQLAVSNVTQIQITIRRNRPAPAKAD